MMISSDDLGRVEVESLRLPDEVRLASATYLPSGNVFVLYRTDADPSVTDWYHVGVVSDGGDDFRTIFFGPIPQLSSANGIRHMPMTDGRRVLLGDYVLECSPSIDSCDRSELIAVEYPWGLTDDSMTTHHWSEIIVSPDGEQIAWTILRADFTAIVAIGRLHRDADRYVILDPSIISSDESLSPDPERPGYFVPRPMRGGEVKQFVRGGTAISSAGDGGALLPDSVVQDLEEDAVIPITRTPGYDETTIFSPDERLGIVMSTRASRATDPVFLGLLPRPHSNLVALGIAWAVYQYTVSGVRKFRQGNVGPILTDIERSMTDPDYTGTALNDPEDRWVYCSPMSWGPDSRKAMWMEMVRGSETPESRPQMRVRIAHLLDREPSEPVPPRATPTRIPYAISGEDALASLAHRHESVATGRIAGAHSGYLEFERRPGDPLRGQPSFARSTYVDYSDDGRTTYNGTESTTSSLTDGTRYEADLEATGEVEGEMRLRATWSSLLSDVRLLFETDSDGTPKSRGFARRGDRVARVTDLLP